MFPIFQYALSRYRGTIIGWGVPLGLLAMYLMQFYDTLVEHEETLLSLVQSYPPEMLAFFGASSDMGAFFSPEGYLTLEFFSYMPLVLGIFAVLAGSGILVSDEENGTLDLLMSHPVSRTAMFVGRLLALLAAMSGILGMAWLGLVAGTRGSSIDLTPADLAQPFFSLGAVLVFFASLSLLFSLMLPSRRMAATLGGVILVGSYFFTSLARLDDGSLKDAAKFSPLHYYQSGSAIGDFNWQWFAGLLAVGLAFTVAAWWLFQRRDLRVGGEGGWRIGWPLRPTPPRVPAPADGARGT